jgi:hypothetical protein
MKWNAVFILINSAMLAMLAEERYGSRKLSEEELRVYARVFAGHGTTRSQFLRLLRAAHWETYAPGMDLTRQGLRNRRLMLVIDGTAEVVVDGEVVAACPADTFIGEVSWLAHEETRENAAPGQTRARAHQHRAAAAAALAGDVLRAKLEQWRGVGESGVRSTAAVAGTHIICFDPDTGTDTSFGPGGECPDGETLIAGTEPAAAVKADTAWGVGFKYSGDMGGMKLALGIGAQANEGHNIAGASAKLSTNGFDIAVNYSDLDGYKASSKVPAYDSHTGIGVTYTTGAIVLHANYGIYDLTAGGKNKGYGLSANYGLGGGATILAGYGKSDKADGGDDATWSLGLGLSF